MNNLIIDKYNVPGPRYTSYPTVPFWKNDTLDTESWLKTLHQNHNHFKSDSVSIYIHLPYCESLCTFCGCHKRITKNHAVETPYINALLKEWCLYKDQLSFTPVIKELHLGGGTPTFFAAEELSRLLKELFNTSNVNPDDVQLGFEAHPNNTKEQHLNLLYDFGFRRISLGIQDYDPFVQQAIHRFQPFSQVEKVHSLARKIGYSSISHDLVFGLPKQTLSAITETVQKTIQLLPDRISLYSYAHVPWIKGNGQRGFNESDLPQSVEKRRLYETAKTMLEEHGYKEIGMDHFALDHDELCIAFETGKMHRNFMGYTTQKTDCLIGLGMSAISDSWFGFAQNEKSVDTYLSRIEKDEIPVFRGHLLSESDLEIRRYILDLMCHFETTLDDSSPNRNMHPTIKERLNEMEKDGLVTINSSKISITKKGIPFVRNCCMAFDQYLNYQQTNQQLFSQTI